MVRDRENTHHGRHDVHVTEKEQHELQSLVSVQTPMYSTRAFLEKKDRLVRCIAKDVMSTSQTPVVSMTTRLI